MTGLLNMGSFKITNVGDPENDTDVVNKKYVDTFLEHHEHDLDVIGRYLVISKNGDKSYVSLRTKKNIDLSNTYVKMTADGNEFDDQIITIDSDFITVPNGNNLSIMQLNQGLRIALFDDLLGSWTFLFSAKPEEPPINKISSLSFRRANQSIYLTMRLLSRTFIYTIDGTNTTSV